VLDREIRRSSSSSAGGTEEHRRKKTRLKDCERKGNGGDKFLGELSEIQRVKVNDSL
jgi:hypothetical protein